MHQNEVLIHVYLLVLAILKLDPPNLAPYLSYIIITTFVFFPHHESLTCTCKVHVHVNVEPTNCFVLIRAIERGTDAFYVKRTDQLLNQFRFTTAC